ncbi:MAG: hypothetical protein U0841_08965 [Chloroflexia bacterium]
MNMSFMLAGSASTNPVLFFLAVALILGWQVAGYYGADRFILPIIGAPWQPGKLFHRGSPVRCGFVASWPTSTNRKPAPGNLPGAGGDAPRREVARIIIAGGLVPGS